MTTVVIVDQISREKKSFFRSYRVEAAEAAEADLHCFSLTKENNLVNGVSGFARRIFSALFANKTKLAKRKSPNPKMAVNGQNKDCLCN